MRTFIALDIPENEAIRELYQHLSLHIKGAKIKYTSPTQNHLTLAFLGEIDQACANMLMDDLSAIHLGVSEITLGLSGLGVFRSNRQPSVLWIGMAANDTLRKLYENVNLCVQNAGVAVDSSKAFSPHITVGRVKYADANNNITETVEKYKSTSFGELNLNHFKLYKSTLTPNGPIYEKLKAFTLQ